jgi:hypothetical protein
MIITVNLVDGLIFLYLTDTPWTNTTLLGVTGVPFTDGNIFNRFNNSVIIFYAFASSGRNNN